MRCDEREMSAYENLRVVLRSCDVQNSAVWSGSRVAWASRMCVAKLKDFSGRRSGETGMWEREVSSDEDDIVYFCI